MLARMAKQKSSLSGSKAGHPEAETNWPLRGRPDAFPRLGGGEGQWAAVFCGEGAEGGSVMAGTAGEPMDMDRELQNGGGSAGGSARIRWKSAGRTLKFKGLWWVALVLTTAATTLAQTRYTAIADATVGGSGSTPALSTITPNSTYVGQNLSVSITAWNTSFLPGQTVASFGAGISVGGAAEGQLGPVTVLTPTVAAAHGTRPPPKTP